MDTATGQDTKAHHQRSDVCAVPAAGVVAEAMVSLVLAQAVLEKFGGDSVAETHRNLTSFVAALEPLPVPEAAATEASAEAPMGDPLQ